MPDPIADPAELEQLKKQFAQAFHQNDAATFRALLQAHPEFKPKINDPVSAFDSPLIVCVRSREMLEVLLEAGAASFSLTARALSNHPSFHSARRQLLCRTELIGNRQSAIERAS